MKSIQKMKTWDVTMSPKGTVAGDPATSHFSPENWAGFIPKSANLAYRGAVKLEDRGRESGYEEERENEDQRYADLRYSVEKQRREGVKERRKINLGLLLN